MMKKSTGIPGIKDFILQHPWYVFFFFSGTGLLAFFLFCLTTGEGFSWVIMGNLDDWRMTDFYRHVQFAADLPRVYENGELASFPPLAYVFFHLIYRLNPQPVEEYNWVVFVDVPFAWILYTMYIILICLLFCDILRRITGLGEKEGLLAAAVLLCSLPFFAGAVERGNPVILTLVLLLYGLWFRDSPFQGQRETALILIAVAANFKLYPAAFGLLYLKERRFGEAARLLLYGLLFFFVPLCFTGGIEGLRLYMGNLLGYGSSTFLEYMSFQAVSSAFLIWTGVSEETAFSWGLTIGRVCVLLLILVFFTEKNAWKRLLYLSFICTYAVPNNYRYTAVYLSIPLLFLNQKADAAGSSGQAAAPGMKALYMALFGMIFTIPVWIWPELPEKGMTVPALILLAAALGEGLARWAGRSIKRSHLGRF